MKKVFCAITVWLILLFCASLPAAASGEFDFLTGDWATSDGVYLSLYGNYKYTLEWGFLPEESGSWRISQNDSESCMIDFTGSQLLDLMAQIYSLQDANYHFEILKCNNDNFYLVQVYGDYTARTSPCKLGFTREGASEDFQLPAETEQIQNEEDYTERIAPVSFHWGGEDDTVVDLKWSWDYFNHPASEYNHSLAIAALAISDKIYNKEEFENFLEDTLGFKDVDYEPYSSYSQPGYALAHRSVTFGGEKKQIVLVAIRGTNLDFGGNDAVIDAKAQIDGFRPGTSLVNFAVRRYIKKLGCKKSNTILFITGHSLGGGIAQSLAPYAENYTSEDNNCFIYTFAATNVFIDLFHSRSFDNVHNIINTRDVVPKYPFLYGKYGHKWYYDSANEKYKKYLAKVYKKEGWHCENAIDEHMPATYFAMMLCDPPDNMGEGAYNPYTITSVHCPVDIEVCDPNGNLMARTVGTQVIYEHNSKVLVVTDGENKDVYSPAGVQYSLGITGTGEGTMTVFRQVFDSVSDALIEEKQFGEIEVYTGQKFVLDIDDRDCSELQLVEMQGEADKSLQTEKQEITETKEQEEDYSDDNNFSDKAFGITDIVILLLAIYAVILLVAAIVLVCSKKR